MPRGLVVFPGCQQTCPNEMQTVSGFFLGPQRSHDLVDGQELMICEWAVWPYAPLDHIWGLLLIWMTDEKVLLVGILSAVLILVGGKRICQNGKPAVQMEPPRSSPALLVCFYMIFCHETEPLWCRGLTSITAREFSVPKPRPPEVTLT